MGGLVILSGIVVATLLWADLTNLYVWAVLFVTLGFGAIGFYDDLLKVTRSSGAAFPAASAAARVRDRRHRGLYFHQDRQSRAVERARSAVRQGSRRTAWPDLHPVCRHSHRRGRQRRQHHRRARRARHRAGDDRRGEFRLIVYLVGNAVFADYLQIHFVRGSGELAICAAPSSGPGWAFCGSTRRPP
jgi:phospho-N-acetylmuramoyl-pentapeptide-transferase